jgi:hypothetical protein
MRLLYSRSIIIPIHCNEEMGLMMRRGLAAALLACGFLSAVPARADIAPPPPPAGADILPGADGTQVRMESETVLIEAAATAYGEPARADVQAAFVMRNLGDADETMQVRFPLNVLHGFQSGVEECVYPQAAPEIADFRARVDGAAAPIQTTVVRLKDEFRGLPEKDVRCWANFPVTFPAGEIVTVEVEYSVAGYYRYDVSGMVEFPYVLVTGAGWQGTIGQAEIIFRAPFELDDLTIVGPFDRHARVDGNVMRWSREDFEPDQNVAFSIVDPGLWSRVEREKANLARDRNDGEAWGRLGRWYKEANRMRRGWRYDPGGPELYQLSKEAYTQAVTLKPNDADWHAGFADLLCWTVWSYHPLEDNNEARNDLVRCAVEVRRALEINPNQALAKQLLQDLATQTGWQPGDNPAVDLSGGAPVYTVLTTTPTVRPTEIPILEPTFTPEPSPTLEAAAPVEATAMATAIPTTTPVEAADVQPTQTVASAQTAPTPTAAPARPTQSAGQPSAPGPCAGAFFPAALIPAAMVAQVDARRKRSAQTGL